MLIDVSFLFLWVSTLLLFYPPVIVFCFISCYSPLSCQDTCCLFIRPDFTGFLSWMCLIRWPVYFPLFSLKTTKILDPFFFNGSFSLLEKIHFNIDSCWSFQRLEDPLLRSGVLGFSEILLVAPDLRFSLFLRPHPYFLSLWVSSN